MESKIVLKHKNTRVFYLEIIIKKKYICKL